MGCAARSRQVLKLALYSYSPANLGAHCPSRQPTRMPRAARPTSRARGLPLRQFSIALAACVLARAEAYTPKRTAVSLSDRATAAASPPPPASAKCAKCGFNADGHGNCCSVGGSWHGTCGDGPRTHVTRGVHRMQGRRSRGRVRPGRRAGVGRRRGTTHGRSTTSHRQSRSSCQSRSIRLWYGMPRWSSS